MPIKLAVTIVRLNVYVIDDLELQSRSQLRLKLHKSFNSYFDSNISDTVSATAFRLGMPVYLCMVYMLTLVSITLTLMQGHSGSTDPHKKAQNDLDKKA